MENTEITRPPIEGIAPYIEVFDMPASLRFYRDLLGFTVKMSSGQGDDVDWVLLDHNGAELMLNTAYEKSKRPSEPDPQRLRGHADLTFYFGCTDIDLLYRYFVAKGQQLKPPVITGYGWKAIYLKDPDGFGLCFHRPV